MNATLESLLASARTAPSLYSLEGKKAVVVGGNKGLGQAMGLALAVAGADVSVWARGPEGLEETAEAVRRLGRDGQALAVDVRTEKAVAEAVAQTISVFGRIDILVNSQGAVHLQESAEFDMDEWDRVLSVNLRSMVLTCKHVGKTMLANGGGKIINISSVRGFQGRINDLAYAPSKGAVNQLTHSLAIEWGPRGINVNAIAPCFIRTEISAPILDDPERRAWVLSRIPMKRTGELRDMFGPVLFLASNASSFVNGHVLPVDGGWLSA